MTDKILSSITPVYGFCPFDSAGSLIECRAKARVPENAQSIIVCLFPYFLGNNAYGGSDISKYAAVPDYHEIILPLLSSACERLSELYPDEKFVCFADNSPIPEVRAAEAAGLGVRGKNGLFISRDFGSWVFIGEIVTTKKYSFGEIRSKGCLDCGKCIAACPSGALTADGLCAEKCLSAVSQRKGTLSETEEELLKSSGCAWGCDICQNVCPMNADIKTEPLKQFLSDIKIKADTENIAGRAYAWRGRNVIERNIRILYSEKGQIV